jgi:putative tryptophan/tyrosine transport system substrate-binding protein
MRFSVPDLRASVPAHGKLSQSARRLSRTDRGAGGWRVQKSDAPRAALRRKPSRARRQKRNTCCPNADLVALLVNPTNPEFAVLQRNAEEAARALGRKLLVLNTSTPTEIDRAFATSREQHAAALLVGGDAFLTSRRQQIVALAARDAVPALYFNRDFIAEGGLMSYGNDIPDAYRRAGHYAGRILKGERPADLPVDQATKFELVINLKTAKTLGLDVPPGLSARADEVIE